MTSYLRDFDSPKPKPKKRIARAAILEKQLHKVTNEIYKDRKKLTQSLDTTDLVSDEQKLIKLYNLVHSQGIPETRLSKHTKKTFAKLEKFAQSPQMTAKTGSQVS